MTQAEAGAHRPRRAREMPAFIRWLLGLAVLLAFARAATLQAAEPADEVRVRAVYLLNFMRYSRWPTESGPLRVAVLGTAEHAAVLREVAAGSDGVHGRPVTVELLAFGAVAPDIEEATRAIAVAAVKSHAIYIAPTHRSWSRAVAAAVSRRPVLTVGPGDGFLRDGGMIGLYLEKGNVRFDVNPAAIRASPIEVSSRLMTVARPERDR